MNDDDKGEFRALAPPAVQTFARRSRPWRWALFVLLAFCCVAIGSLMLLLQGLGLTAGDAVSVTVDGETWRLGSLHGGYAVAAVGLLVAVLAVLCIVPLALLLGLVAAALGIGVGLLAVLAVAALLLSPLLLPALLLWWLLRPRRPAAAA